MARARGLGWDLEAFGIHKGTKKLEAAQKLADWASSKDAMLLYGKNFAITAQPGVAAPLANVPADYEKRLVKMDFKYAADNRELPGNLDIRASADSVDLAILEAVSPAVRDASGRLDGDFGINGTWEHPQRRLAGSLRTGRGPGDPGLQCRPPLTS